jgi:ABC-2 type transport system ATP-binding protein
MTGQPPEVPQATVVLDGVSKWFGQKVAVSDVSCSFGPGVTGLLGPNGAGKTTLLRLLTGILVPSAGSVRIHGQDPRSEHEVYRRVGLVPEDEAVYSHLTARQFIRWSADLTQVEDAAVAVERVIRTVALEDVADRRLSTFSKGMRQRAKVASALVHDPDVLFLDEPLNGADPVQRAALIDLFVGLGAKGRTVVVSSHVLAEVERMADRVIAMIDGRLAAAGTVTALRDAMSDIPRRIRIECSDPRALGGCLLEEQFVSGVELEGDALHVQSAEPQQFAYALPPAARRANVRVTRVEPEDDSLESVFRYLVAD